MAPKPQKGADPTQPTEPTPEEVLAQQDAVIAQATSTNTFQRDPNMPVPPRLAIAPSIGPKGVQRWQSLPNFTGSQLVNRFNVVERPQYDEVADAKKLLDSMPSDVARMALLKDLSVATNGLYKPDLRGAGLQNEDYLAVGQYLLRTANNMGRTYDVALEYMKANVSKWNPVGTGRKYTVSSSDDIKEVLKETSLLLLGYIPDAPTLNRLVGNIQGEQVRAQSATGTTYEQSTTVENQAVALLEQTDPMAARVEGAATIAEIIREALGG
jgi:hypothetical protein